MIIYGSTISPFVRKAVVFAREKGVEVELRPGGMGRGGDEFEEASPFRKMPALRDPGADGGRDFTISDSTAIVQYLEAKHPEPNLIPTDAIGRARAIWYEEFGDTIVMAVGGKLFGNRFVRPKLLKVEGDLAAADAAERDELPPILDYLERCVPDSGFLVEDRLTLADIAVASPFVNYGWVGVAVDGTRYPRTVSYLDNILARPSFADLVAKDGAVVQRLSAA
ncbi:glutathione S-transferase family protein [Sphingomonas lenta]|uniref:Glutathione S-transferase n=1 Tax=Sphingomonas lenta TaxID=1141887 RepID=A0A2A2SEP7_9SPHN|nr:glutathione S-transferase family protein [Sphingomonas lenta]PAX07683.1 glutathione S-transferase [Sphingomonas lenta]